MLFKKNMRTVLKLKSRLMDLIDSTLIELKIQVFLYADYSYSVRKPTIPTANPFFIPSQFDQNQQICVSCA